MRRPYAARAHSGAHAQPSRRLRRRHLYAPCHRGPWRAPVGGAWLVPDRSWACARGRC